MKQQTSAATETRIKGKNIIDFSGKTLYVGIEHRNTHIEDQIFSNSFFYLNL